MITQSQQGQAPVITEPLVVLLTQLLVHRLTELGKGDIVVPDNVEDREFEVDPVPDWKESGYTLSANFSRFVDHLDAKLVEEAEADLFARDVQKAGYSGNTKSKIECVEIPEGEDEQDPETMRGALTNDEKWIFIITLVPHIYPHFYDSIIHKYLPMAGDYPQMGFIRGKDFRGFIPTGETIFFLLAGNDFERRLEIQKLFHPDHFFARKKILELEELSKGDPVMSGKLVLAQDYLDMILFGRVIPPGFSISFPAREIKTRLDWDDLVIGEELETYLQNIMGWLRFNDQLLEETRMGGRLRKGYRCLFYGPSGTGKTFTAGLLGKCTGKPVYKIDLSMIVSKYIGETEKNLEIVFARAEDKNWIIFFDEADALFGKRTSVKDAHDKYANQEVSYLLQRIEDYSGLVILASNMKNNIDDAFMRRFNIVVKFPFPDAEQREQIWRVTFPKKPAFRTCPEEEKENYPEMEAEAEVDIPVRVKKYELTGGHINNIVHYASLKAVERMEARKKHTRDLKELAYNEEYGEYIFDDDCFQEPVFTIYLSDVLRGIEMELVKEGKPFRL